MRIAQSDLQALRNQADIADVISHYIPVEKKGKDHVAVCPFHDDHDPSLHISGDKQIFKCFVCGAGGDVFSFVEKYEKVSFVQAVQKVADYAHYSLPFEYKEMVPATVLANQDLYKTLDQFSAYCRYELSSQDGQLARNYLEKRKVTKDIIDRFEIGYAPSYPLVKEFLEARFANIRPLEQSGLVRIGTNDLQPVFFERLMIPLHDVHGRIVGYTARVLPGDNQNAKYINTSQTVLYEKGKLIFNYHRAKEICRQSGRLILCEGAMDVIGLAKAGFQEGIACLGTACSQEQLDLMKKCQVPIVVFYDQDAAGQKAIWNFGQKAMQANLRFSIVKPRSDLGKDPDEIYLHHGKEALNQVLSQTISFAEFAFHYLQEELSLDNYEDKKSFALKMEEIIRMLDPYEQPAFFEKLQTLTGFHFEGALPFEHKGDQSLLKKSPSSYSSSSSSLPSSLPSLKNNRAFSQSSKLFKKNFTPLKGVRSQEVANSIPKVEKNEDAQKYILWLMLYSEEYVERFLHDVGFFQDINCSKLGMYIQNAYHTSQDIEVVSLCECVEEEDVRDLLASLDQIPDCSLYAEAIYKDSVLKIQEDLVKVQIQELKQRLDTYLKQKNPLEKSAQERCLKLMEKKRTLVAKQREITESRKQISINSYQNF